MFPRLEEDGTVHREVIKLLSMDWQVMEPLSMDWQVMEPLSMDWHLVQELHPATLAGCSS